MTNEQEERFWDAAEVEYKLTATVNGIVAGTISDYDPDVLIGQVRHLEEKVAELTHDLAESAYADSIDEAMERANAV